jgi:hypothetical protein
VFGGADVDLIAALCACVCSCADVTASGHGLCHRDPPRCWQHGPNPAWGSERLAGALFAQLGLCSGVFRLPSRVRSCADAPRALDWFDQLRPCQCKCSLPECWGHGAVSSLGPSTRYTLPLRHPCRRTRQAAMTCSSRRQPLAGCSEPLPKLRRVRGSESPRALRSLLPQTRTRVRILPWPPDNPSASRPSAIASTAGVRPGWPALAPQPPRFRRDDARRGDSGAVRGRVAALAEPGL